MHLKRILCIEDHPESRLLLRKILERGGYEVYEANDGITGVGMARRVRPDLILMDINIPGLNGYESTTRIKGIPHLKQTPIVALTAQSGRGARERSLTAGCDGYLSKPITARALLDKVESALGGTRERLQPPEERNYLKAYSHRLVERLEEKIVELAGKNRLLKDSSQAMQNVYIGVIGSLMNALEQKDIYTAGHSARVTRYALHIGAHMGLPPEDIKCLARTGKLHDVGKLVIDLASINKSDRLTTEEWHQMKEHPSIGAHILSPLTFLDREIRVVEHHHERWDGAGYPAGLQGSDLDLLTCVITAADSYDAMTSARSYRHEFSDTKEIVTEIRRCRGAQFHPEVAETLIALLEEGTLA